ncbi:MAG: hypothetical protein HQL01_07030 [Nitrospirae bacterium]|nr:hypothetical protein [Nitrospirota bacterium]
MIEREILLQQALNTIRLLFVAYMFFYWVPLRIFPQEYIENLFDRVIFNIIHMTAVITLIFPLLIYIKVFGFGLVIIFFFCVRFLFLKFYYKIGIYAHVKGLYIKSILNLLKIFDRWRVIARIMSSRMRARGRALKIIFSFNSMMYVYPVLIIGLYAMYLRLYRSFISLAGAVPDMYQYYYWNNILKLNVLFDIVAGAPYMWSGPVMLYTLSIFSYVGTVSLYNLFPVVYLLFSGLTIVYVINRFFGKETHFAAIALMIFGVLLASPLADAFFGSVSSSKAPQIFDLSILKFYYDPLPVAERYLTDPPFLFYWRFTTTLPYEVASGFFLINIYFLAKFIKEKSYTYLLLYAESLAIILSIHGGVAIPLFPTTMLMLIYAFTLLDFDFKSLTKFIVAAACAVVAGSAWMVQFLIYGLPEDIGAAAPVLDKLIGSKRAIRDVAASTIYSIQLLDPTPLLLLLVAASLAILIASIIFKKHRLPLAMVSLTSIGVLLLYAAPNLGAPQLVNHTRLRIFLAYSYALVFGAVFYYTVEWVFFKILPKKVYKSISVTAISILILLSIIAIPRWMDTSSFWDNVYKIESNEMPYVLTKIADEFQPFTYQLVSSTLEFPQMVSQGYHINSQDFLQQYNPFDKILRITTDYIIIPIEKQQTKYEGQDEYWYRWKKDIKMKLTDWVVAYMAHHDNIKLWFEGQVVDVYLIDNRVYQDMLQKQQMKLRGDNV